jgi:hypothetical protein
MYYSYVEIEYVATSFSPARTDLALKLLTLNPGKALLPNPFQRGYHHQIERIHRSQVVGGANGSARVVIFVDCCVGGERYFLYYSYCRNPTGREFFVPAGTL